MFSLESPHRGDSNEYIQYTVCNMEKEQHPKLFQLCSNRIYSKGLKNEFETAVVNEPSVFEPLKFYCTNITNSVSLRPSRTKEVVILPHTHTHTH